MAMRCPKCNGIIPDVMFDGRSRCDCSTHIHTENYLKKVT